LDPAAELLAGTPAVPGQMPGLDGSFDTVLLVGFHARMGTSEAYLDHSVSTAAISEIRINGRPLGEIGIYAANAGFYGVPVSLVTGDTAAVAEARELLGPIETVAVKHGFGRFSVRVSSPERAHEQIHAAAERAVRSRVRPFTIETPVRVAIDFLRSAEADMAAMMPGAERSDARTVEYSHPERETAFAGLQTMLNLGGIAATRWATALYTTGNRVA
jgi:D-amino peptidase